MTALDLVSDKQLHELTGLDARTCRKHALGAGLHEYDGKRFEREPALAAIKAGQNPNITLGNAMATRGGVVIPGAAKLAENRARSEAARAVKLERENAIKSGDLIPRAAVKAARLDTIARARTHFMGLGPRCAAQLSAMEDEGEIRRFLDEEARTTLHELARMDEVLAEMLK